MKKIFIYYSHTGNGDIVKEEYEKMEYDIKKIIPKRNLPKSFFLSVFFGGMLAGMNHKSKLKDFNVNIKEYDEIVIGSPIWNGNLACPMNKALSLLNLDDKKLTFVLYSGSGTAKRAIKRINKKYNAKIICIQEPKKYRENLKKLEIND